MTDYSASPYDQAIPSKSTIVPSENNRSYKDGDEMHFEVPNIASMAFIDMSQSYLMMKVKANCNLPVKFNTQAAAHALIDRVLVMNGENTATLENCEDYAERVALENVYTSNESIQSKRRLLTGQEGDSNNIYSGSTTLPGGLGFMVGQQGGGRFVFNQSQFGKINRPTAAVLGATNDPNPNTLQVILPLKTGILQSKEVVPNVLLGGMRVSVKTNKAKVAMEAFSLCGQTDPLTPGENALNAAVDLSQAFSYQAKTGGDFGGAALTQLRLSAEVLQDDNDPLAPVASVQVLPFGQTIWNGNTGASNLQIGQTLYATCDIPAGGGTSYQVVDIGKIVSYTYDITAPTNPVVVVVLDGSFTSASANEDLPVASVLPYGGIGWSKNSPAGVSVSSGGSRYGDIDLELSEVQLVVKGVQPPKSFIDKHLKAVASEEGSSFDILSVDTYRNTIPSTDSISMVQIPCMNERALSLLSLMYKQGSKSGSDIFTSYFFPLPNNLSSYSYLVANQPQPTQAVSTERTTGVWKNTDQLALWELTKCLGSGGNKVRNNSQYTNYFAIGRALARYGGYYGNCRADGGVGLKMDYSSAPSNTLLHSYLSHYRRINISKNGVRVDV